MTIEPERFTCEITATNLCIEDEDDSLTYGVRAISNDKTIIYEFRDISTDKNKVEQFVTFLNDSCTPLTHLHYAVMDFLQAM